MAVLRDQLGVLDCPVFVLRGSESKALTVEGLEDYRARVRRFEAITLPGAGHDIWNPDYDRYINTVRDVLSRIDASARMD